MLNRMLPLDQHDQLEEKNRSKNNNNKHTNKKQQQKEVNKDYILSICLLSIYCLLILIKIFAKQCFIYMYMYSQFTHLENFVFLDSVG